MLERDIPAHLYKYFLLHLYYGHLLLLPLSRVIIKIKNRNRKSLTRVYYGASSSSLEVAEMSLRCTCSKFFFFYFTIFSLCRQIRISRPRKLLSFRLFFSLFFFCLLFSLFKTQQPKGL